MAPFASQISADDVREDVGRVLIARDSLADFAEYVSDGWYVAHEMHHLIGEALQDVLLYLETGGKQGTQFLIILTPPQHGKSTLTSQFFPAFALGKLPNLRVSLICYGENLAAKHSRAARNMIRTPRYQAIFGERSPSEEAVILSDDSKSVTAWDLAAPHRGGLVAAGVGGAISGFPRGLFIWDDPIKDHRESQKKEVREDVWEFYLSSMRVRMDACVLVMTHWHPDDPAGRLLKQMISKPDAGAWKVLALPGIAEPGVYAVSEADQRKKMADGVYMSLTDPLGRAYGEVLCPAMLSKAEMLKYRATDTFYFTALFQQLPYAKEGQRYKKDWFVKAQRIPDGVKILLLVRYYDKAASQNGDFTVGVLMAYCSDGMFYILDVVRGQWSSHERDNEMKATAKRDKETYGVVFTWHQQDPGSAGVDSALATNRVLAGHPAFFEPVSGSKEIRSGPLESAVQGKFVILLEAAWNDDFTDELCAFPNGSHDDQVDAASSAYAKLLEMVDLLEVPDDEEELVVYEERVNISPV